MVSHYLENHVTAIAWLLPAVVGAAAFCGFLLCAFGEVTRTKWAVPLTGVSYWAWGHRRRCSRPCGRKGGTLYEW
nr:hypothetical protein [uncultured Acetatifactor sp.]